MTGAAVLNLIVGIAGVVGAAAGVIAVLQPRIREAKAHTKNFGPALAKLQDTITLIAPKIEELDRMNQQCHANFSEEQIRVFTKQLEKGKELVIIRKAITGRNKNKKRKYTKMIVEVDSSLMESLALLWDN